MLLPRARVGIAQWHPAPGRPTENLRTATRLVAALAEQGAQLVILPELWPSGYDVRTLAADVEAAAEPLDGPRDARLRDLASRHRLWLFAGSVPEQAADAVYNTSPVYSPDGDRVATHRKVHLYPTTGEAKLFAAGGTVTVVGTPWGRVGMSVCFDGDHPGYSRALRDRGARIVVSVSAYETDAAHWWDLLHPAQALASGQWWLMANQSGGTRGSDPLGGSRVLDPGGRVVAAAPRSGDGAGDEHLLLADLDLAAGIAAADRSSAPLWEGVRPELYDPPAADVAG
ncbi:carbon-nitrogen hydrolase family protein [Jiangella aurantiaca]|uniref:Carbon-nitrogen hydrolase family protein n=1 Tax=Jiangella aurantiaca TaxID=2530373 RepID=A0A4R5AJU1_9ACTN|nr:carbon-nitrogen hydrolase family protein [Jiangella aurantiaca]TDD71264.1 carbon-nitrogen hydrolase family protein [Jiangella aurantiaca]